MSQKIKKDATPLDGWIIEEIRRKEEEKRKDVGAPLYDQDSNFIEPEKKILEEANKRGVEIIDLGMGEKDGGGNEMGTYIQVDKLPAKKIKSDEEVKPFPISQDGDEVDLRRGLLPGFGGLGSLEEVEEE